MRGALGGPALGRVILVGAVQVSVMGVVHVVPMRDHDAAAARPRRTLDLAMESIFI